MSPPPKQPLVWLITGTSTGIGRELALAALRRNDKVIATARSLAKIGDLKKAGADILQLDVTDSLENLHGIAKQAFQLYGRFDVLVNNAGYGEMGTLEEGTPAETYQQYNTHIFGALNTTRAILPYMRAQRSGTVVWIGSYLAWAGYPGSGLYASTKFAIRGLSEILHHEISPLGLRSICFEPGYFRTPIMQEGRLRRHGPRISDYNEIAEQLDNTVKVRDGKQPGDPKKLAEVILDVIRGEGVAQGRKIPLTLAIGSEVSAEIRGYLDRTSDVLKEWEDVINGTDFDDES